MTCDDEPTPFVLDVRLLASCSRMQLLDGRLKRLLFDFVLVTRMKIALGCIGELSCEFSPGKG